MEFFEIPQIEGLNRKSSPYLLKEGQVTECQNVEFSKIGTAAKTGDYELNNSQITASQDILGQGMFTRDNGNYEHYVICDGAANSDIYKDDSGWTAQSQSLTAGARGYFVSMPELDFLFFANLSDDTRGYNGSSWSTSTNLTDAPKAQYCNTHDTRLFLGNCNVSGTDYPTRYYYSTSGYGGSLSWDSSDYYTLPEEITGFAENRESQLAFTKHTVFRADAYDKKMIANVGAYSQDVIANYREWTIFADAYGNVYATDQSNTQKVSHPVQDYIDGLSSLSAMRAVSVGDHYYLYIGNTTIGNETLNKVVLDYDFTQNKWGRLKLGETVKAMGTYISSGVEDAYFGNGDGEIFKMFSSNAQNDSDYVSYLEFPPVSPDGEINNYEQIDVWGDTMNGLAVQYKIDRKDRWQSIGELRGSYTRLKTKIQGEELYLRMAEAGQGDKFEVYRIRLGYNHARENI